MPMGIAVGWQDRDWAKWTDEERSRFLGGSTIAVPGAFVAVVASLVATVLLAGSPGIGLLHRKHASATPIVYGTGPVVFTRDGLDVVCTQLMNGACSAYTVVAPGEHVLAPAPPPRGMTCPLMQIDQARGAWFCAPVGSTESS